MTMQTIDEARDSEAAELEFLLGCFARSKRAAGRAEGTITLYTTAVRLFWAHLAALGMPRVVSAVRREHVESWLATMRGATTRRGQPYSRATLQARHLELAQFWNWLVDTNEIPASPMARMHAPPAPLQLVKVYTVDELRRLLKTCESGRTFEAKRDHAVLRLLLDTGLRISEAGGLTTATVDLNLQVVTVLGKGGTVRAVPYANKAAEAMDRYARARRKDPRAAAAPWWLGAKGPMNGKSLARIVKARAAEAGLSELHAHSLRHQWAHMWRAEGGEEGDLMALGGWKSRKMLDRYGRSAATERAHKAARERKIGDMV